MVAAAAAHRTWVRQHFVLYQLFALLGGFQYREPFFSGTAPPDCGSAFSPRSRATTASAIDSKSRIVFSAKNAYWHGC